MNKFMNNKNKKIDLHMHSTYSDGTYTPKELVQKAKEIGLSGIALTDHDTIAGIKEAKGEAERLGIKFIPGVEFSAKFEKGSFSTTDIHILAFNFDMNNKLFNELLVKFAENHFKRNLNIIDAFEKEGINIKYDEILKLANCGLITKVHFVEFLLSKNHIKEREEGFARFFTGHVPTNIDKITLEPKECIEMIHKVGGVAVLAHPFRYRMNADALIDELISLGIDGIEVIYPTHSSSEEDFLKDKARQNGLIITGGSDFHGVERRNSMIGCVNVPYELLEKLL